MDLLVKKSLEIIDYFKPRIWILENPATGNLRKREVVKDIPFYDVDYCMYSDWGYKKKTRFWTNIVNFVPKLCNKNCGNMVKIGVKHIHKNNCGNGAQNKLVRKHKINVNGVGGGTNRLERYRIPPKLIEELLF